VTIGIVDDLEVVEVNQQQGKRLRGPLPVLHFEHRLKHPTVVEAGQMIPHGKGLEPVALTGIDQGPRKIFDNSQHELVGILTFNHRLTGEGEGSRPIRKGDCINIGGVTEAIQCLCHIDGSGGALLTFF